MPTIDRRDFLKFIVGGAVGTVISPLPWVPMDEVAKWSQRWAPIPEKGESSYLNSICLLCPGGCGIKVRLIEKKRAVKIDGQPNHPVNRGGLCPLGLAGLQNLYHEEIRVKGPMKRFGPRGKGDWLPVSWEEAYSDLTKRFKELRENNQAHTVALLDGRGGQGSLSFLMARFMRSYGSPNYIRTPRLRDTEEMVTASLHGVRSSLAYDLPNANYILSFGTGLLDGWGTPTWVSQAYREWRKDPKSGRARLVQVESLASTTASLADEWVPVKPRTEGALAWGLAQIMIAKGWVNRPSGLESLKEVLDKKYTPDKVAKVTGLPPEELERLAKEFATAKQGVALLGRGKGEMPIGFSEAAAVQTLNILVGAVNRSGGVFLKGDSGLSASWPKAALDGAAEKGQAQPRLDSTGSTKYPAGQPNYAQFFVSAAQKTPYPINLLMLHEANPAFTLGEAPVKAAVEQIPFIASFSSFYNETTQLADLILPAPTFLERWDDAYGVPGVPYPVYGLAKPVLPPLHGNRNPGDVLIALAKNLGGSVQEALGFENMEAVVKQSAMAVFEMKKGRLADGPVPEAEKYASASFESFDKFWEGLVREGAWYHLENAGGQGRVDLYPAALRLEPEKIDLGFTCYAGDADPLLMVPLSLMLLQDGYLPNPPFLTKYLGEETLQGNETMAQIHPATAKKLGLTQGDPVQLQSAEGSITVRIHLFEGARPGVVFVPLGMGHQAFDPTLKNRGANPYPMLDRVVDPASGLPISWATRVKINKIRG
jgi:anaerobic selenocysteine-containing dehydrogenase